MKEVGMMNYKKMIDEMLCKIKNEKKLKKIFDYICYVYLKK